jgi:hypothetical protein
MSLVFYIFPNDISYHVISYTPNEIAIIPQLSSPKLFPKLGEFLKNFPGRYAFHYLYYIRRRISRRRTHEYMNMVFHDPYRFNLKFIFLGYLFKDFFEIFRHFLIQYLFPIFRYPYQVILQIVYCMFRPLYPHAAFIPILRLFGNTFSSPIGEPLVSPQQAEGY